MSRSPLPRAAIETARLRPGAGAREPWLTVASLQGELDADLLDARRRRSGAEVAAIRSLKSALANAEAVPVPERPFELVPGRADVPRRTLAAADIAAIIESEISERQRAVDTYRATGADTAALELQLATLRRYCRPR